MFGYDLKVLETFLIPWTLKIITAIAIAVIGWILTKIIVRLLEKYLNKYKVDIILVNFTKSIVKATLLLFVAVAALSQLGINTTSLIALIGAAGLAVGLALQDSLKNFASGVMLILYRPFNVGDYVKAGGSLGSVEKITMFTTTLNTPDNLEVIVPNADIYAKTIVNYSSRPTRRLDMVFGINKDEDILKIRQILNDILAGDERVLKEPPALIAVSDIAGDRVNIFVRPWVKTEDYNKVQYALAEEIKHRFSQNGISVSFP
jgi:small conductance mechanosensitive channel